MEFTSTLGVTIKYRRLRLYKLTGVERLLEKYWWLNAEESNPIINSLQLTSLLHQASDMNK